MRSLAVLCVALLGCVEAVQFTPYVPPTPPNPTTPVPRLPANNAYVGSVVTGSLRPLFSWEAATIEDASELTYELQVSPDRTFATRTITVSTTSTTHQHATNLPVATTAPVGQRYYWRVRACADTRCSDFSRTWWVNVGRSTKDFNGDGYDDVVVGSHTDVADPNHPGRVFVYFGNPGLINTSPDGTLTDSANEDWFGFHVASAGDFNGDGFADVLVSAPRKGAVYLYFGGPGLTFDSQIDIQLDGSALGRAQGVGDIDGDGYSDIAANTYATANDAGGLRVYFGGARPNGTADATVDGKVAGQTLANTFAGGDLNGDGYSDIVLGRGNRFGDSKPCTADVYLGGADVPLFAELDGTISGLPSEQCIPHASSLDDMNGDGFADVLIWTAGTSASVRTYLGAKNVASLGVDTTIAIETERIIRTAMFLGDVNNDGAADLGIADFIPPANYRVSVHLGKAGATSRALSTTRAMELYDGTSSPAFGLAIAGLGDINGDGIGDFAITDPAYNMSTGRAYLFHGNTGATIDPNLDMLLTQPGTWRYFGESVALLFREHVSAMSDSRRSALSTARRLHFL